MAIYHIRGPFFYKPLYMELLAQGNPMDEVITMAHESVYFSVTRIQGSRDAATILKELDTIPGVMSVSVNARRGNVAVDYDSTGVKDAQIQRKLESLGYSIESISTF